MIVIAATIASGTCKRHLQAALASGTCTGQPSMGHPSYPFGYAAKNSYHSVLCVYTPRGI